MKTSDFFKRVRGMEQSHIVTVLAIAVGLTIAMPAQSQNHNDNEQAKNGQGGGNVLPPNAQPHGYGLDEMAKLMALFNTSGNNPRYYPKTPFQILFGNPSITTFTDKACPQPPGGKGVLVTGGNTFVVQSGTPFFVPLASFDDSPPVVGVFPTRNRQVADYVFGPDYGARGYKIIVDGERTRIGPDFLSAIVEQKNPPLLDGGGTHLIQLGAFLTPMSVGTHIVEIEGEIASTAILAAYGISCVAQDYTYTVKVIRGR